MDPLSHAILGATAAGLKAKTRDQLRVAALCGALAGMFPDLDILIRDGNNPMLGLGYHRHFTHALLFVPVGAALVAIALHLTGRFRAGFSALYLYCLCGMACHGLLDAMTNYGTHLFWPFTHRRESWSIISIIDPLFTLPLLALLVAALRHKQKRWLVAGLCFALLYWSIGYAQRERATTVMQELANRRGHRIERFEVKPSFANLLVWRTQYIHQETIHIDAVHISPWKGRVIYEGSSLPQLNVPAIQTRLPATQFTDLAYFQFFSDGWLAYAPQDQSVVGDIRFSMLPHRPEPIWGIRLLPGQTEAHVDFVNLRNTGSGDVKTLWKMIRGEAL